MKMKAFTDLEQSKKMAEFLPIESADMYYVLINKEEDIYSEGLGHYIGILPSFPCWSLAALFNYLREIDFFPYIEADEHSVTMSINYYDEEEARLLAPVHNIKVKAESFVDACVAMIEILHEQKLL